MSSFFPDSSGFSPPSILGLYYSNDDAERSRLNSSSECSHPKMSPPMELLLLNVLLAEVYGGGCL